MKSLVLILGAIPLVTAQATKQICPLKGQQFPSPAGLAAETSFQNATQAIEQMINGNLTQAPYNETTFSIGMFSTSDDELLYQFHYTDPSVANSSIGANKVDADSIYRIGSISKILTVYQWLIKDGDRKFNQPISDFIPQLLQKENSSDYYAAPDWSEITVNDLAMFLAGIARDYGLNDVSIMDSVTAALPPMAAQDLPNNPANGINISSSDDPVCGYFTPGIAYDPCSLDVYVQKVANLASSFAPGYTPLYSNANFALVSIALANMIGNSSEQIFNDTLVYPLGLNGTTIGVPSSVTEQSVIPKGNETSSGWNNALGPLNGAAGAFSTTNDLATIGKSILNNTLMSQATTNRWYTTTSFVDTIDQAVGRGWEIFRLRVDSHTVTMYTKSGNWGVYASVIFLIPDYDFGFSVLTASDSRGSAVSELLPDIIVNTLLPVLESIAKQQANTNFAGTYSSSSVNSTVTITTDEWPALKVTEYVADGVDLLTSVFALFGDDIDFRIVPNRLYKNNLIGFTGIYQPPTPVPAPDEFYWPCQSWLDIDDFTYASVPLGSMVFEMDATGNASSLQLKAFRETLQRN